MATVAAGAVAAAGAAAASCFQQTGCMAGAVFVVAPGYCEGTVEIEYACAATTSECSAENDAGCCEEWQQGVRQDLDEGQECVVTMHLPDGGAITKTVTVVDLPGSWCTGSDGCDIGVESRELAFP